MKTLKHFMLESMEEQPIFESFGSTIIGELFSTLKKSHYNSEVLFKEMQWDKITDSDVQKMDIEAAKKLAYKKDSDAYLIWVAPDGQPIARTIGHYSILLLGKYSWDNLRTVKKIASISDYAISVLDSEKFSTEKLRQMRREAKKDALALKTEEEVRQENLIKFRKMREEMIVKKDANSATLEAKFEKAKSAYNECADAINNLEILKDKVKYMQKLNSEFDSVLSDFYEAFLQVEDTDPDIEWSRKTTALVLNALDSSLKIFDAYCKKLLVKISD